MLDDDDDDDDGQSGASPEAELQQQTKGEKGVKKTERCGASR